MFTAANLTLMIAALAGAGVFFHPRLLKSRIWRATVTPLASIIGSGFLVAGPVLAHAAGTKAWVAMAGLCLAGYVFGAAVRFNIRHVEPLLEGKETRLTHHIERASQIVLSLAYFISVAYYISLFSAFVLRSWGLTDPSSIRIVATIVIAMLGALGFTGGLSALERLEVAAVGLKLCIIAGLLLALCVETGVMMTGGDFNWVAPDHPHGFNELRVVLGLMVLVQGFETSRYLGAEYDAETRVKTMRRAQWLSSAIYVSFILLSTAFFVNGLPEQGGETAIIDMLAPIGPMVAPLIILAALASQLSAAVADMNGAGGLLAEGIKQKVSTKLGDAITAAAAILVVWTSNIYEIIAFASKAFVAYYALQSFQACLAARRKGDMKGMTGFGALAAFALAIVIFAKAAEV
ncbi:MAG: hypothetical protein R3C58_08615 [Parvularculaceae bacterium]